MLTLGYGCCPRSADSKSSWHMGMGCVEARALLEPGPSFCWDPALKGSTSPSSSFFYALGKVEVDKIHRRQVLRSRALPTPARASATPPRADPAPSRRLAPPERHFHASHPRYSLLHSCLRRSSILLFYSAQGRWWRTEAGRRPRRCPYGPGGRLVTRGAGGGVAGYVPSPR